MAAPVLAITGPGGVGKTTVAFEVSRRLEASGTGHALIDTDELDRLFPPPSDDPRKTKLAARNLAAAWANFRASGADRRVILGVMLCLDWELPYIETSVPDADVTVIRLRATEEELLERVWRREVSSGGEAQIRRAFYQLREMDQEPANDALIVETSERSVAEVASEIIRRGGWPA
jgi:cytidylate kinase